AAFFHSRLRRRPRHFRPDRPPPARRPRIRGQLATGRRRAAARPDGPRVRRRTGGALRHHRPRRGGRPLDGRLDRPARQAPGGLRRGADRLVVGAGQGGAARVEPGPGLLGRAARPVLQPAGAAPAAPVQLPRQTLRRRVRRGVRQPYPGQQAQRGQPVAHHLQPRSRGVCGAARPAHPRPGRRHHPLPRRAGPGGARRPLQPLHPPRGGVPAHPGLPGRTRAERLAASRPGV
ncbi:MAG: hypothetical protein AVDCRST_MAG56-5317, partial [uncultured Cytophagales bacterium]